MGSPAGIEAEAARGGAGSSTRRHRPVEPDSWANSAPPSTLSIKPVVRNLVVRMALV